MKRILLISATLALLLGIAFVAVAVSSDTAQAQPPCDIEVSSIVASKTSLSLSASGAPDIVNVTATFQNNGPATCSFARWYSAELAGDVAIPAAELGVRVEPVGNAPPPYGDVCLACATGQGNKTARDCLDPLQGAKGPFDPPPVPPQPWTYTAIPCDEGGFNSASPFSRVNESCENWIDELSDGMCNWGGFSARCGARIPPDVNCVDVPFIGLIPLARRVLGSGASDVTERKVKVECRTAGSSYDLVVFGGVNQATDMYSGGSQTGATDPDQANDTLYTVITVTCGAKKGNTPKGSNVLVPLNGGTQTLYSIDLTFSEVTEDGDTSLVTSTTGPPPPTGSKIVGLDESPLYFDINTDASYSGDLSVCVRYDESQVTGPEDNLKLMQRVDGFDDITTSVDTANHIICGTTTHLSIFVVAEPVATATPTPTRPPGVGGTVKLPPAAIAAESSAPAEGSGWGTATWAALAGSAVAIGIGGWYARRRWLR